ncbi:MAG: phosphodiester glycosidase family protein [Clostridia bacterium]|nr:phosphodiester glycosidase family protein [Clostridia bacterium]
MKNTYLRILSAVLLICLLLSAAACGDNTPADTSDSTSADTPVDATPAETTTAAPPVKFTLTDSFVLLRADEASEYEIQAYQLLYRGIQSAYGIRCALKTDFVRVGDEIEPFEFEILVGDTNRTESQELGAQLSYYDWEYRIVSPNVIAICGGSPEATLEAARAFLADVVGYEENEQTEEVLSAGSAVQLETGTTDSYKHTYEINSLKLGERDISEYTLVAKTVTATGVDIIVDAVDKLTGKVLSVVATADYEGGPAIYFGCADKGGAHLDLKPYGTARYYITESGDDIIIDFKSSGTGKSAASRFVAEYLAVEGKGDVAVSLGRETVTGIYIPKGTNSLSLDSVTVRSVADGITYEERLYYDPDGAPVRAYILTVESGAASFATSMPSDGTETGKVSNIPNQIKAAVSNGKKVIAGINADFFDMGGTNVMRGLCIKDGVALTGTGDRPWFGITKDGTPVIGTAAEYEKYEGMLETAVGGSHIMLRNDATSSLGVGTEFGDTRHPRTAVGIKPDGSVVLMVVDGRQSAISNGASLADLAELFASLGCSEAINLDGGGSSTFVLKNASGEFVVENSPSEGALRSVANGLLLLEP